MRLDHVAERLGHLAARLVNDKPVGDHLPVRRRAPRAETDQQRALEPAAVLVGAFEVQRQRPAQLRVVELHAFVARSGIEPDIEDVLLPLEVAAAARRAAHAGRQEVGQVPLVPGVRPMLLEQLGGALDNRRVERRFTARHALQGGYRHAPRALARDAPVGPCRQHVADPLLAPGREPLDLGHGIQGALPQLAFVHRDEPLGGGQEDDRAVAAPAVRIRMLHVAALPEAAARRQRLLDLRVGVEHPHAAEQFHLVREAATGTDRGIHFQPVALAGQEVVRAVPGRGVDGAGALFQRDVVGQHDNRLAVVQRMPEAHAFEQAPLEPGQRGAERPAHRLAHLLCKRLGDDHDGSAGFVRPVVEVGVQGDCQV